MTREEFSRSSVAMLRVLSVMLALSPGLLTAQPPSISIEPANAGPVNIADLRVLLGDSLQFQMFDFESQDNFCLSLSYVHDHDGHRIGAHSGFGLCNRAGRHRFIVTTRRVEDQRYLSFALHDLDTGMGATVGGITLPIPAGFSAWTGFRPADTLYADRDVTLLRWSWSVGHRGASDRSEHEISIGVRFGDNTEGTVGTL